MLGGLWGVEKCWVWYLPRRCERADTLHNLGAGRDLGDGPVQSSFHSILDELSSTSVCTSPELEATSEAYLWVTMLISYTESYLLPGDFYPKTLVRLGNRSCLFLILLKNPFGMLRQLSRLFVHLFVHCFPTSLFCCRGSVPYGWADILGSHQAWLWHLLAVSWATDIFWAFLSPFVKWGWCDQLREIIVRLKWANECKSQSLPPNTAVIIITSIL